MSKQPNVRIAYGSSSNVAGTGFVKLNNDLILNNVLFVPSLSRNLLSVSQLTSDLKCITKFYDNTRIFQDSGSRKTIGSAELYAGLYLLNNVNS